MCRAATTNFMVLTRAEDLPGPDGKLGTADDVHSHINQTSPFVDQSQTYSSDPSHQVFLREYMIGADGKLHSTGALLSHHAPGADGVVGTADDPKVTMATWGDLKANAATFLGIKITDADVGAVPLLATDPYGNFIRGAHGLPQLVVNFTDPTTHVVTQGLLGGQSRRPGRHPRHSQRAELRGDRRRQHLPRRPGAQRRTGLRRSGQLAPDADTQVGNAQPFNPQTGANLTYDDELLDAHYVAGDGRVNENIGLTAIHELFHSEHDRLLRADQDDGPAEPRRR